MKKTLIAFTLTLLLAGYSFDAAAQGQTLYDKSAAPGGFAYGQMGANTEKDNFMVQWGGGSWTGMYASTPEWITLEETGDMDLVIEVDIEQFVKQTVEGNKVYFHWSNLSDPTVPKTADVGGILTSNHGQYIGLDFTNCPNPNVVIESTGNIKDGMIMTKDADGDPADTRVGNTFDLEIKLTYQGINGTTGGETRIGPDAVGNGGIGGSVPKGMWWLINNGLPGEYEYDWNITLNPDTFQQDGNYQFDPRVTSTPAL